MKIMKDFFNAILTILLFPFQFISFIVNEIKEQLSQIQMHLQENKRKKKQQNQFDELKSIILGHNQTKVNQILHTFILLATTGLQFISLFTTYAGTNYYFGNVTQPKFLGPLILSCVIQFSLLFLSNTIIKQERVNKGSKGMLAFFLCISILFSYAGMIHTLVPPYKKMKSNYDDFISKYEDIYEIYQSNFKQDETIYTFIDSQVNQLQLSIKNQIKTTKAKLDSTSKYSSTSSSSNSVTNNNGETSTTHSSSQTINEEWTKLNNEYNTYTTLNNDLTNQYKQIKETLIQISEIEDKNTLITELKNIDADAFISTYNYCIDTLQSELSKITQLETIYYQIQKNNDLIDNKLLSYEEIEEIVQVSIPKNNSNLEYLTQISNLIDEQIVLFEKTSLYLETDLSQYHIDSNQLQELKDASLKAKTIEDFNILAYGYLNPTNSLFSKAIITFFFAIFIDLTTFLMPYFMNKRNINVLFMNKKKALFNEEEILIQTLESYYMKEQEIYQTSCLIKNKLNEFLSLFEISKNQAIEDGYSYMCDSSTFDEFIKNNREMTSFVLYALNLQYLYKDETNIYKEENKVYLRTKFVLWIQNVMTSLSKMKIQSEDQL